MQRFRPLLVEHAPLARAAHSARYPWLVVGTVCVGAFLGQLDASIAGLILPTLESAFGAPIAAVEWVAIAYLLTLAALVVPLGRLADLAGRKVLYTTGFLIFVLGSALCGLAPGLVWLVGFRVLQAVGAAMLQANSVAIITAAVPRVQLGRAIGVQGAAQAVGLSVGPSLGGFLIDAFDWRAVFFIAVPFGLIGTLLGWLLLPKTEPGQVRAAAGSVERFDWPGALLLGPGVALALFALTFANTWGWGSPRTLLAVALAAVVLGAFWTAERRAASPLIDLRLFREGSFSLGIGAGLLAYAVLFGSLFLVPFYLERVLGRSAQQTGLLLAPVPVALGLLAPVAGGIADRIGPRVPTLVGMLLSAAALGVLAATSTRVLPLSLGAMACLGIGLGLFMPANNSGVMASVPRNRLGVAGGVLNMTRSLGTSIGVAASGAVLTALLAMQVGSPVARTADAPLEALRAAFHESLLFLAFLAVVSAILSAARCAAFPEAPTTRDAREAALSEGSGL
jgi:EmrB/QacA subfamily drug resistance transporter